MKFRFSSSVLGTTLNRKQLILNCLRFLISTRVNAASTDPTPTPRINGINLHKPT